MLGNSVVETGLGAVIPWIAWAVGGIALVAALVLAGRADYATFWRVYRHVELATLIGGSVMGLVLAPMMAYIAISELTPGWRLKAALLAISAGALGAAALLRLWRFLAWQRDGDSGNHTDEGAGPHRPGQGDKRSRNEQT